MNNKFRKVKINGVVYFVSLNIKYTHGFSTRIGGVSKLPHLAEMNLGRNLGDDPELVCENYRLMGKVIGFDENTLVYTNQIHSANVKIVTAEDIGKTYDCDGFVTKTKGVTLAVRTADCTPILLADNISGVIGAVHAGWRGTASGIQKNAVMQMISLGASPENICCAIGACIHKCCYEVGEDFYKNVKKTAGENIAEKFIEKRGDSFFADIAGMNYEMLCEIGIKPENISVSDKCTCCEPELFFSHRATKGKRGVMSAFIAL